VAYGEAGSARDGGAARRRAATHYALPVLAAILTIVALLGVGAAVPPVSWASRWRTDGFAIAASLDALLVVLWVALRWRQRARPLPGYPAAELRRWLRSTIGVSIVGVTIVALMALAGLELGHVHLNPIHRIQPMPKLGARRLHGKSQSGASMSGSDARYLLYGLLGAVLLAAIIGCLLVLRRLRRSWLRTEAVREAELDILDQEGLRKAVASGRSALHQVDDAQAAIIACYAAMEASLAAAGASRLAAETPDELLSRAQTAGVLRGPDAATLVALFYEARYSTHPLPPAVRQQAKDALDAILAELAAGATAETPGPAEGADPASAASPAGNAAAGDTGRRS
jgi:Domain of unknown function (DUF4129)